MNTDKVVRDLKTLTRDAEGLLAATADDLTDKAREARSRLTAALRSAKDTCERMQDKAVAGLRATDGVIRKHPYETLGIAFGAGLLIGALAIRRNHG